VVVTMAIVQDERGPKVIKDAPFSPRFSVAVL
jgi:hypothetical protein